jgi:hypothetical protein
LGGAKCRAINEQPTNGEPIAYVGRRTERRGEEQNLRMRTEPQKINRTSCSGNERHNEENCGGRKPRMFIHVRI